MKFTHLSRVYLSDDEYYELLSPKNISQRGLLRMAREDGFIFGEKADNEWVRSRLSMIPSDWPTVSGILEAMAKPDPAERKTSRHLRNVDPKNDISKIIAAIKESRSEKKGEIYNVVKISPEITRVEVTYTEVDYSKATPYQRRERMLFVDVTKAGGDISFKFSANDRAKDIVDEMQGKVISGNNEKPESISLFAIRDATLRTKFFTELIKDISDHRYENATQLSVDRRFPREDDELEEEGGAEKKVKRKVAEKVKGLVNKMALSGEQVLAADLYNQAATTGYYICNISWSCVNQKDSRFHIDCEAGFSDPVKADQFTYDVVRKWRYKPENPDSEENVKMTASEQRGLSDLVEEAAFRAFEKISKPSKK